MQLDPKFSEFLLNSKTALANFLSVVKEWEKLQNTPPASSGPSDGPKEWHAGEDHPLTTAGISDADIDAIEKGYAEATKKEKAIEFIKGFVTGVMMAI